MKLIVRKSHLKGTVTIPGSKSHTIRAVAIASLAKGQSAIHNPLTSSDTQSAVNCYRAKLLLQFGVVSDIIQL